MIIIMDPLMVAIAMRVVPLPITMIGNTISGFYSITMIMGPKCLLLSYVEHPDLLPSDHLMMRVIVMMADVPQVAPYRSNYSTMSSLTILYSPFRDLLSHQTIHLMMAMTKKVVSVSIPMTDYMIHLIDLLPDLLRCFCSSHLPFDQTIQLIVATTMVVPAMEYVP